MIALTAGAVAGVLVMLAMWSSSWLGPGTRVPFDPSPAWYRSDHGVRSHRRLPDPGRDWQIA